MSTVLNDADLQSYVITPPKPATLTVADTEELFPVHRVYCVGRNYAAHAVEMGHDPDKEPPFFFQKNPFFFFWSSVGKLFQSLLLCLLISPLLCIRIIPGVFPF